jgi:hypothetical protein
MFLKASAENPIRTCEAQHALTVAGFLVRSPNSNTLTLPSNNRQPVSLCIHQGFILFLKDRVFERYKTVLARI